MNHVINSTSDSAHGGASEDLFAEKFLKVTFRDYTNNTRMDIKNVDLKNNQIKRDRMLAYWQNNVAENFLPPISAHKRDEVEMRKMVNEPLKVKKENVISINSANKRPTVENHD